jgi:flagellum-specific peptidoglycan hydrolase FlgJ
MENLETRLNEVARIAVYIEQQTACPAQLLIAQWAIESKWGEKPVGHANYFGIKRAARHAQWCTVTTREVVNSKPVVENLEFADYDSFEDSCRDYTWLITNGPPYHAAWEQYQKDRDLHTLIAAVARVYAADPNYAHLAGTIAGQTCVDRAITETVGKEDPRVAQS